MATDWFTVADVDALSSPALLVYAGRVDQNLRTMLSIVGDPKRLRPHIKTHKMPELVKRQLQLGIDNFKCATIAEAEMAAEAGAPDIFLAYQLVGSNVRRFLNLKLAYPQTRFSTLADDCGVVDALSRACVEARTELVVHLDLDCGMHRSGIAPGIEAHELYKRIDNAPGLVAGGLQVYDGHIHDTDAKQRKAASDQAFEPARTFRDQLLIEGAPVPAIVAGGSPTFPFHAAREPFVQCSPGTTVLWDAGYSHHFPDLPFLPAAVLLSRVVSKPGPQRLCVDLGHKSVAAENPLPNRVRWLNLPDAQPVAQSEEHLVLESSRAGQFKAGDVLYGIPWHICPTVALHARAVVVEDHRTSGHWQITARNRTLSY